MKKTITTLLLFAAFTIQAQVTVYTQAQVDAAIAAAVKSVAAQIAAIKPGTISQADIDAAIVKLSASLVPQYTKTYTSKAAINFNIDTLTQPTNTAFAYDLTMDNKMQGTLLSATSQKRLIVSNLNGVYTIQQQPENIGMTGNFTSYVPVATSAGILITCRPPAGVIDWTLNYTKRQL